MVERSQAATNGRFGFFIHSVRKRRGAEKTVLTLVKGLASRGHQVDLLLEDPEEDLPAELPAGVRVVDLSRAKRYGLCDWLLCLLSLLRNLARRTRPDPFGEANFAVALGRFHYRRRPPIAALRRYIKRDNPTAVISFLNYPNAALLLAAQWQRHRPRILVSVRNHISTGVKNAKSRRMREMPVLIRNLFPFADRVVVPATAVGDDIRDLTNLQSERVATIFNPVFRPEILELAKEPASHPWLTDGAETPVVLAVGGLQRQKDFATLLCAFALLRRERPLRLIILGEGAERAALTALAHELGIAEDVDMPGFVDNPYPYFRGASVFVLSSAWEGLPNVLIEAMVCGCPVVSTDCPGGAAEILDGGRYGALVPVADPQALAEAVSRTLRDPLSRQKLLARAEFFAIERVLDHYTAEMSGGGHRNG